MSFIYIYCLCMFDKVILPAKLGLLSGKKRSFIYFLLDLLGLMLIVKSLSKKTNKLNLDLADQTRLELMRQNEVCF